MKCFVEEMSQLCIYRPTFVLRKYDVRGRWSAKSQKIGGGQRKQRSNRDSRCVCGGGGGAPYFGPNFERLLM